MHSSEVMFLVVFSTQTNLVVKDPYVYVYNMHNIFLSCFFLCAKKYIQVLVHMLCMFTQVQLHVN